VFEFIHDYSPEPIIAVTTSRDRHKNMEEVGFSYASNAEVRLQTQACWVDQPVLCSSFFKYLFGITEEYSTTFTVEGMLDLDSPNFGGNYIFLDCHTASRKRRMA
jgi:hypothetical protein